MTLQAAGDLSTTQADALVAEVVQIYTQLEDQLLAEISASVAKGAGQPKWKVAKLFELTKFRASVAKEVAAAGGKATGPITQALLLSEKMGRSKALAELKKIYPHMTPAEATNIMNSATKIKPLVKETVTKVVGQHAQILRSTDDIYRKVVAKAAAAQTLGAVNHQQAIQKALNEFGANGVTGFVDKSGKSWDLESYTKMATHTAVHRASIEGHVNGLREHGQTLVYVSDHLRECPLCRPWEGKILSTDATFPTTSSMAIATLAQAQAAGFMHPYCRHTVNAYFPGITQLPFEGTTADPAGSAHRTQQRALERGVRYWKRREILATTPKAKADAVAHGKEWKSKLNAHKATEPHQKLNYAQSQAAGYAPGGTPARLQHGTPLMGSTVPAPKAPDISKMNHAPYTPGQYSGHTPAVKAPEPAPYVLPHKQALVDKAQKAQEAYWHAESTLPPGPETKKKLAALKSASTKATNAVSNYGQPKAPPKPKVKKTGLGLDPSKVKPSGNWEDQLLGNGYQPQAFKPAATQAPAPKTHAPISKAWADKEREPWRYGDRAGSYGRDRYIGSAYSDMNGLLRGESGKGHAAKLVEEMDTAFAQHASIVPKTGLVFRGVRSLPPELRGVISVPTDKTIRFIEPGWSSTSVKEGKAFNGHRYVVTVPQGTKVVPGTDYEDELILPRTAEFELTYVETGPGGYQVFHLKLKPTPDQLGTPTEEQA